MLKIPPPILSPLPTEIEIASEAYIYFYPIIVYTTTLFYDSVWPHTDSYFSMNTFNHRTKMLDWTHPSKTDPSVDHLYSLAWLDLEKHPIVLSIPDIPQQVCDV